MVVASCADCRWRGMRTTQHASSQHVCCVLFGCGPLITWQNGGRWEDVTVGLPAPAVTSSKPPAVASSHTPRVAHGNAGGPQQQVVRTRSAQATLHSRMLKHLGGREGGS